MHSHSGNDRKYHTIVIWCDSCNSVASEIKHQQTYAAAPLKHRYFWTVANLGVEKNENYLTFKSRFGNENMLICVAQKLEIFSSKRYLPSSYARVCHYCVWLDCWNKSNPVRCSYEYNFTFGQRSSSALQMSEEPYNLYLSYIKENMLAMFVAYILIM